MSRRLRASALWIAPESSYGTDPSTNGSLYKPVRAMNLSALVDALAVLETGYSVGVNAPTPTERGTDGCSLNLEVPAHGYAAALGDGDSPAAEDYLDLLLNNFLGQAAEFDGEGAGDGTGASALVLDSPGDAQYAAQDVAAIWTPSVSSTLQYRVLRNSANPFSLDRNFDVSQVPTADAVAYGSRQWRNGLTPGASLSAVIQHDDMYFQLGGGRVTSAKLSAPPKQIAKWSFTVQFDSNVETSLGVKTSLPAMPTWTPGAIKCGYSPLFYNGTLVHTSSLEIDFGVRTVESLSTAAANGRADIEVISVWPTISMTPLFSSDWRNAFRNATVGSVGIQLGGGILGGGCLNSNYLWLEQASIDQAVNPQDSDGQMRGSVQLKAVFNGALSGAQRLWTLARV